MCCTLELTSITWKLLSDLAKTKIDEPSRFCKSQVFGVRVRVKARVSGCFVRVRKGV